MFISDVDLFQSRFFHRAIEREGFTVSKKSSLTDTKITLIKKNFFSDASSSTAINAKLANLQDDLEDFLKEYPHFRLEYISNNEIACTNIAKIFEDELKVWVKQEKGNAKEAAEKMKQAFYRGEKKLSLSGLGLKTIPSAINYLENLTELYLDNNKFSNIPEPIFSLTNLTRLNLSNNLLAKIPSAIGNLTNLVALNLSKNQLIELPSSFENLSNLTFLSLDNNQFTELPQPIISLIHLIQLRLENNQLRYLPDSIAHLTNLQGISLSKNYLTILPDSLINLINLRTLCVNKNQLGSLPSQIGRLSMLGMLDIEDNPNLLELPRSLGQCPLITQLPIHGTNISSESAKNILAECKENRKTNDLPKRLEAWQVSSNISFDLNFIQQFSVSEKQIIHEWLTRLEHSNDFNTTSKTSLAIAVCGMLESLRDSPLFNESFFTQVPDNLVECGDRASMAFNELYMIWRMATLDPKESIGAKLAIGARAAKTAALRAALQRHIDREEKANGKPLEESVEVYLYYESHLKDKLGLLTFMQDMLYPEIGQVDWIDEKSLIDEVNNSYLDILADFPSIRQLCLNELREEITLFEDKAIDAVEKLEDQLNAAQIDENFYRSTLDEIKTGLEANKHRIIRDWLNQKKF